MCPVIFRVVRPPLPSCVITSLSFLGGVVIIIVFLFVGGRSSQSGSARLSFLASSWFLFSLRLALFKSLHSSFLRGTSIEELDFLWDFRPLSFFVFAFQVLFLRPPSFLIFLLIIIFIIYLLLVPPWQPRRLEGYLRMARYLILQKSPCRLQPAVSCFLSIH